jgi:hypothetical protein
MAVVDESERKQVRSIFLFISRIFKRNLIHSFFDHRPGSNLLFPSYQAMAARLEALENDAAVQDTFAAGSDDEEFVLREDSEGGKKKNKFCCRSFTFYYFVLLSLLFPLI